jgi:superfamily II DNA or RNA helicase
MHKFETAYDMNFFIVPKKDISKADLTYYRQKLIAVNSYDEEKRISMYNEDDTYFYFPRYFFKDRNKVAKNIIDNTDEGSPAPFNCSIKLWDYQQVAINEFNSHLRDNRTGFFLGAAPGSGKTQMGIKMLHILGKTALIIVPKKDLIHQWIERILKTTDLTKEEIGICQGGKIKWEDKKIVVGLIHTVVKYIDLEPFRRYFGVLLFDECDSSVPPNTFAPAAIMFNSRYRIAMTASETRADGLHVIFQNHLVEVKITCEKSNTMTPDVLFVNYTNSSGKLPHSKDRIKSKGMLMSMLAKNEDRNKLIASYICAAAIQEERPTVILSDRISQLHSIKKWLVNTYKVSEEKIGFYIGNNSKAENKRVADNCLIILASFSMMSRGTDIPRLSCMVLATFRSDMRQTSGRIERVDKNKKQPIIIDIIDTAYPQAVTGKEQRFKFYQSKKMKMFEKNA